LKRAPDRVVAAVPAQPVGFRPEMPTLLYDNGMTNWGLNWSSAGLRSRWR